MTLMARAAGARLVVVGATLTCLTMLVGGCGTATGSSTAFGHLRSRGVPGQFRRPFEPNR